jgi:tRNA(Ile)-lysidine synthase
MAASRKSKPNEPARDVTARVREILQRHVAAGARVAVGLSGGVDSVVLLDVLHGLAGPLQLKLSAIHVNHGLSPNAGRWTAFCRELCRRRAIPLRVRKVAVTRGNSTEASARAARYAVFHAERAEFIALAHNRDDQAETLLLQLLRGAGVKGLSAMPVVKTLDATPTDLEIKIPHTSRLTPHLIRPLLDVPRSEILDYARRRELQWIEDESNADTGYDRNFLRHRILPLIAQRWPGYRTTLARSARHLAHAADLCDMLAMLDAQAVGEDGVLKIDALRALGAARAGNVVRRLLGIHGVDMPNTARLDEFLRQAFAARRDAQVRSVFGGVELRQFAGALHLVRPYAAAVPEAIEWHGERRLRLPEWDGAMLVMKRVRGHGIRCAALDGESVTLRPRHGGERLRPDCTRPRRSLKNLLQESRVPPWQRERLPLLFCGAALVWAPDIGIDCRFQARAGEPGLEPSWIDGK